MEINEQSGKAEQLGLHVVGGSVCCPNCGSSNYKEYEELMYVNGIDDPQYGGKLKMVKYGDCRDC